MPSNPNSQTALEVVTDAFAAIRVFSEDEETLDAKKAALGFKELCGMMDQWRLDGWLADNANGVLTFPITQGKSEYTVGPGEDVDVPVPPSWITQCFLTENGAGRTYPVPVVANEEIYRSGRSTNTSTPYGLYLSYVTEWPVSRISFWPIPGLSLDCTIVFPSHVAVPATLNDPMDLSPGMRNALVYCLAAVLSIYYPTDASGDVKVAAAKYVERIKAARTVPVPSSMLDPSVSQPGTGGRNRTSRQGLYDIKSNSYVGRL